MICPRNSIMEVNRRIQCLLILYRFVFETVPRRINYCVT